MRQRLRLVGALALAAPAVFAVSAGALRPNTSQAPGTPVRLLPPGQAEQIEPGRIGATYLELERQATKVVSRFADATTVAERRPDGDIVTTVRDGAGNEIGRLTVDRVDDARSFFRYAGPAGQSLHAAADVSFRPGLASAGRQAYILWKAVPTPDAPPPLEWRGGFMQRAGGPAACVDAQEIEQEVTWADGITSRTARRTARDHEAIRGRRVRGDALVTRLSKQGVEVGAANWFPAARLFVWRLPGLSAGYIDETHLRENYGGWPFAPDPEWMNLQTMAFYRFKILIDSQRFIADRRPGWPQRLLNAIAPTLSAYEDGCDNLHWLDGSVFRYCCDVHDYCYAKNGCTSRSWWQVWTSWKCDFCNAWVVDCFLSGGAGEILPLMIM